MNTVNQTTGMNVDMNESWEQKLIKTFEKEKNKEIKVSENFNCRSNTKADIQYTDMNGINWFIEAKSFKSPDKYNGVHKIFGELLKMSKFAEESENAHLGILVDDEDFLKKHLKMCNTEKLLGFGQIFENGITVFISSEKKLTEKTWTELIKLIN